MTETHGSAELGEQTGSVTVRRLCLNVTDVASADFLYVTSSSVTSEMGDRLIEQLMTASKQATVLAR